MSLIVTQSEETAKKLQILNKKRENGAAVGVLEKALTDLSELNVLKTGAEFMLDRLQAGARKEWEEMLHFVENVFGKIRYRLIRIIVRVGKRYGDYLFVVLAVVVHRYNAYRIDFYQ